MEAADSLPDLLSFCCACSFQVVLLCRKESLVGEPRILTGSLEPSPPVLLSPRDWKSLTLSAKVVFPTAMAFLSRFVDCVFIDLSKGLRVSLEPTSP